MMVLSGRHGAVDHTSGLGYHKGEDVNVMGMK